MDWTYQTRARFIRSICARSASSSAITVAVSTNKTVHVLVNTIEAESQAGWPTVDLINQLSRTRAYM